MITLALLVEQNHPWDYLKKLGSASKLRRFQFFGNHSKSMNGVVVVALGLSMFSRFDSGNDAWVKPQLMV